MSVDPMGDFPTPPALADAALAVLAGRPAAVLEPSCGAGAFLGAAARAHPEAIRVGVEANPVHAEQARRRWGARVHTADAFSIDWTALVDSLPDPVWVVGNPPWVTAAALGALGSGNAPARHNDGQRGIDALTGASNFDLAEWFVRALSTALLGRDATVAMLCKTSTARRLLSRVSPVGLWRIDAARAFGVQVEAGWFVCRPGANVPCPVYPALDADAPECWWHLTGAGPVATDSSDAVDLDDATGPRVWRSGVKHDCARVMVLRQAAGGWQNGLGEAVDLEGAHRCPWLRGGDLHHDRSVSRALVLSQRHPSDDTGALARTAPRTWAYLQRHAEALDGRRSRIWRGANRFGLFGVGPYSFAPYKVAVSALHSELRFRVVGPHEGRAVLLDDTCYFRPCDDLDHARAVLASLTSQAGRRFFEARRFRGAKRQVTRRTLDAWTAVDGISRPGPG